MSAKNIVAADAIIPAVGAVITFYADYRDFTGTVTDVVDQTYANVAGVAHRHVDVYVRAYGARGARRITLGAVLDVLPSDDAGYPMFR